MQRTIYITRVRDSTGQERDIIGRLDIAKATRKGLTVIGQRSELRFMDDLTFYNNSYIKGENNHE